MIKFVHKDGDHVVDLQKTPFTQPSMFQPMEDIIRRATSSLVCPEHGAKAYATIILNILNVNGNHNFKWGVTDFCCSAFDKLIGLSVPSPLNLAKR